MISSIRLSWAVRARLSRFMLGIIDGRRLRDFSTEGEGAGGEGAGGEDDKKKELFKTVNDASPVSEGENSFRGKANSEASDWGTKTVTGYSFDELLDRIAAAQLHRDERIFQSQPPAGDPQRRNRHRDRSQERRTLDNIDELVDFLTEENARDVCVIRVPPEREYVEYFVVCSGLGTRHIHTMAENLAAEVSHNAITHTSLSGGLFNVNGIHR